MKRLGAVLAVLSLSAVISPLFGATQLQEIWGTYMGIGLLSFQGKETTTYGDLGRRIDSEHSGLFSRKLEQHVEIERPDLKKTWEIDPRRKRYTEEIWDAHEKPHQETEYPRQEGKKEEKKVDKEKEPRIRIRSVQTKVDGPGAPENINGFSCRLYKVTTVTEYESLPDHKLIGRQTMYEKQWTTLSPLLTQYHKDEWGLKLNEKEMNQLIENFRKELKKAQKEAADDPWLSYMSALQKISGDPLRTLVGFTLTPEETPTAESAQAAQVEAKEDDIIEPEDLSNGVGGFLKGIAGRWAAKKIHKKIEQKINEHPAWVDELSKDLNGQTIGWSYMNEIRVFRL